MKEILQQLAAYNIWANQKLAGCMKEVPAALLTKEVPSSLTSIHSTLLHMWNAESVWWQRLQGQSVQTLPGTGFTGSTADVQLNLLQQNTLWQNWVSANTVAGFEQPLTYTRNKTEHYTQPIYQLVLHVFNHGTYHRGQIVNMLRQVGIEKIPQTDFIAWVRQHVN